MKKTMRDSIQIRAMRSGAAVTAPPRPSAAPSSRASRTCFLYAVRARLSGVCPPPATRIHSSAAGPKRSAAASAMCSGARVGSLRIRRHSDSGTSTSVMGFTRRQGRGGYVSSMTTPSTTPRQGILSDEMQDEREQLIELLQKAYWMEIETVMSYIANSINPDGIRAQEIKESLDEDIQEELGHAQQFGARIKELYGTVPGSLEFSAEQSYLQPPDQHTDIVHIIRGVIEAETGAIEHYNRIIEFCDGKDFVTQDMVIAILRDEEGHKRLFEGFLRECEADGLA